MPSSLKGRYLFFFIGVLVLGWIAYLFYREGSREPAEVGKIAPDFELTSLSNQTYHLSSLRGKVILLNFWATWCGPCQEEVPSLERFYQSLKGEEGFELLAVSVDRTGREDVEPFIRKQAVTFPILLDSLTKVSELYQVYKLPETFLIDGEGKIVEHYKGPREWDSPLYQQMIRQLIAQMHPTRFGSLPLTSMAYAAEFYQWTDEKGTVHYVDDPSKVSPSAQEKVQKKGIPEGSSSVRSPKKGGLLETGQGSPEEEPTDSVGHTEAWWQERVSSLYAEIEEVETRIQETDGTIHSLPADARILEVQSEQQKLQDLIQKKKDLQKQRVDLEEEARKAGAPPGWLRTE